MNNNNVKIKINEEVIEQFLAGNDPQKYIVSVEASPKTNVVSLIINDPIKGKYIEKHKYKPFIWLKHNVALSLYGGKRSEIKKAMKRFGVTISALKIEDDNGNIPERINNGFKYIAKCNGSYYDLVNFFKQGGVDIYSSKSKERLFFTLTPAEQFLIQTGKRLFKGMDDYDDVHRFQFDLETEGLDPKINRIFQIGMRDNRGFEMVVDVESELENKLKKEGKTPTNDEKRLIQQELRDSERNAIKQFFEIIDALKPDVITGYNSENFDWDFFYGRCERLYIDIKKISKTLSPDNEIFRKNSTLKLGQETEYYEQTYMWGYNILDIMHSVRKAQAINSDIKKSGLKYITKFSKVAKKNRVYIPGDKLFEYWKSNKTFYLNDENGDWFIYDENDVEGFDNQILGDILNKINSNEYKKVSGKYLVERYLLDDLWETEQIDAIYNQATFLVSKILPTTYMRAATMGTAGTWKLIMAAWSYENKLAIPDFETKRDFTGGLSRLLVVGYAKNVVKLDFAALYPKTQLTHNIVPKTDISGVMLYLLSYIVDKRDEFKFLKGDMGDLVKEKEKELDENINNLSKEKINELKNEITKLKKLESDYDKKQLPLKILANSFFGSFGAPYLFPWGETDAAEETTCRGRQYLRLMVKHFTEKYGFKPLVGDTDGFNFAIPDNINDIKYTVKANHWKTSKYKPNQELRGLEAVLAEFNEEYMIGRMGLDIDEVCESTINFARKNYANKINGKVKLVGNTIKSKVMPVYIEEFIDTGINLLLDNKGYEFIELYYDYVNRIVNHEIPLSKIATKKRVKQNIDDYINIYCKTKTAAGNLKSRQAHMELIIKENLNVNLGDTIYYVNVGTAKSHGDIKTTKDKKTGKQIISLNCKLIPQEQLEKNPNLTTDEYNVPKYLEAFNKRVNSLLVCFSPEIRDDILINVKKDKKTKELILEERPYFTKKQCELDSGNPFEESDQDSYEDLMTMEDKEIKFWSRSGKIPNNMSEEEFREIEADWKERMRIERLESIKREKKLLDEIFYMLEIEEINQLKTNGILPKTITNFTEIYEHKKYGPSLFSIKWGVWLCKLMDIFKYEDIAIERNKWYLENKDLLTKLKRGQTRFDIWKENNPNYGLTKIKEDRFNPLCTEKLCSSEEWNGECPCFNQFDGDKDKLNNYIETFKNVDKSNNDEITIVNDSSKNTINDNKNEINEKISEGELHNKITLNDVENCDNCEEDEWNF